MFLPLSVGRTGFRRTERALVLASYVFATFAVTAFFNGVGASRQQCPPPPYPDSSLPALISDCTRLTP